MRAIDADALIQLFRTCADNDYNKRTPAGSWSDAYEEMILHIEDMPTIETDRKTGMWIREPGRIPECPFCGEYSDDADKHDNGYFCPKCVASLK